MNFKKATLNVITTSFFFCFLLNIHAQSINEDVNLKKLLFNKFVNGVVSLKNGTTITTPFNYNTDNQNFIFVDRTIYKELDGLESIDSILIDSVKFIPIKNKFYECTSIPDLVVSYSNIAIAREATTDKTGSHKENSSQISNIVSNVYVNRNFRNQNEFKFIKHFWIKEGSVFIELKNAKQIANKFNINLESVKSFFRKESLDLAYEPDVIKLYHFINSLKKKV
jgi:hypothetical protein